MTKQNTNENNQINKDMTMDEIFQKYPDKIEKITETALSYGLHCSGCFASTFETLEQGVIGHGMSEKDLNNLLKDLNELISK